MALPRGAIGMSTVCDCGIPDHTHYFHDIAHVPFNKQDKLSFGIGYNNMISKIRKVH